MESNELNIAIRLYIGYGFNQFPENNSDRVFDKFGLNKGDDFINEIKKY